MLDPLTQRVLAVLVEKELTVPASYPLSESAVLAACNQKSNRDPEMSLSSEEVRAALDSLRLAGWASRVESPGARTRKWRHHFESQLGISDAERAVLIELLLRGPQAPGALKSRVGRLGLHAEPERILAILEGLAQRAEALVERLPRWPRERDCRWQQLLCSSGSAASRRDVASAPDVAHGPGSESKPSAAAVDSTTSIQQLELAERVSKLEHDYAELVARVQRMEAPR